jgi:hypothetical protein
MKCFNLLGIFLFLSLCNTNTLEAQRRGRFIDAYPLAMPSSSSEYKAEFEKTLGAVLGGIKLLESPNVLKSRSDEEAYIVDDYKSDLNKMITYAKGLCEKTGNDVTKDLDNVAKAIKGSKYGNASGALLKMGAKKGVEEAEHLFFVWRDYLQDIEKESPWTNPKNIKVTRIYRMMINYVGENYDRPFGIQAEQGAVVADGAQALSNCLENPTSLDWKGEAQMGMKEGDQLRRLVSNVAYYDWRIHDKNSGQRAAHIDKEAVRLLQQSLYDVVRTILKNKENWDKDAAHGKNLLALFHATSSNGWSVNGDKAQKQD